ncbi:MAG: hypothetical protein Q9191_005749 [Dirinaria sp. TL-2023a]
MSSLKAAYQSFLSNPDGAPLNDEASLDYITTLTTIKSRAAVVKHFAAHQKVLKKKEEKILSAVEGNDALCLEIETTLEFLIGGGAYLPGVEENFLADRVVIFPIIHIVHFDANQKIQSIRLNWDQGSLLKQVEIIGARARSWPIRDGKDQARLIASSAASAHQSNTTAKPATTNGGVRETSPSKGSRSRNHTNVTRDPHASLALFAPRDEADDEASPRQSVVAPRASARPPPRDYGDLFAGEESAPPRPASPQKENRQMPKAQSAKPEPRDYHDLFVGHESDASPASKDKPSSPLKNITSPGPVAPKTGAGKNFQPMRLFENIGNETRGTPQANGEKLLKPHPQKYNHFEFGHGDEEQPTQGAPQPGKPKTKHQSQWDFDDFATPQKLPTKRRPADERHFGWSDDEPAMGSPTKDAPAVSKPRPDAKAQFEFQDDGTPAGERRPAGQPRGNVKTHGMGLYQDNLFGSSDHEADGQQPATETGRRNHPLAPVTNLQSRGKDFDAHFSMTNEPSPSSMNNNAEGKQKPIPENRSKAVKTMEAQWEAADPVPKHGKENFPTTMGAKNIGIKSAGDGMGGKKGAGARTWGFGDESGDEAVSFHAAKKQGGGGGRSEEWEF